MIDGEVEESEAREFHERRDAGLAKVLVEKVDDGLAGLGGFEGFAAVAGAGEDDELGGGSGGGEGGVKTLALIDGHAFIGVAVHDEESRIVGAGLIHCAGVFCEGGNFEDGGAEEFGAVGIGDVFGSATIADVVGRHGEEVGGTKPIQHGLDAAGGGFVFWIQAGAHEGDKVTTGGGAGGADVFGVEAEFLTVVAQPADGGVAVVDLGGPAGDVGLAKINAGDGEAVFG